MRRITNCKPNIMKNIFLRAKHWQIFIIGFAVPFLLQFGFLAVLLFPMVNENNPEPTAFFRFVWLLPVIMIFNLVTLYGWIYSVAIGLQDKIPFEITMKVKKFKILFFFPPIYILLFLLYFILLTQNLFAENWNPSLPLLGIFVIIIPIHFFSLFCTLHTFYFTAKTIKTVELQRETSFSDFVGEFFMIWFFFVGVWILQPKINKMIEKETI